MKIDLDVKLVTLKGKDLKLVTKNIGEKDTITNLTLRDALLESLLKNDKDKVKSFKIATKICNHKKGEFEMDPKEAVFLQKLIVREDKDQVGNAFGYGVLIAGQIHEILNG